MSKYITILLLILLNFFAPPSQAKTVIYPAPGMKAPDFILQTEKGKNIKLSDYMGKNVLLLNFWAFWCDTWQDEADGFYELKKKFPDIKYSILSVSVDGKLDMMLKKKENLIYYPILLDLKSELSGKYGIENVPTLFIIDKNGIIRYKFKGYPGTLELYNSIKKVMSEKTGGKKKNKKIALTFDDFPDKDTPLLLDILKKEDVKATFFVTGEKGKNEKDIITRAYKEGHEIEIHCFHHIPFIELKKDDIISEITGTSELIYSITGKKPLFIRPPGNHVNEMIKKIAHLYNLELIDYTINPFDYQRPGEQILAERIFGELKRDEEIILLHDGVTETRNILPEFIGICKSMGYEFIRLTEIDKGSKMVRSEK